LPGRLDMKNILGVFVALLNAGVVYAAGGAAEFRGSHSMYDVNAEMAILKKIESQTDPATEKVIMGGMALKFEYLSNTFGENDGYQFASAYFSDKNDKYVFDYYVDVDKVIKIVLFTKNNEMINKQVYPEKEGSNSDRKK
jgi:hypothetical protein